MNKYIIILIMFIVATLLWSIYTLNKFNSKLNKLKNSKYDYYVPFLFLFIFDVIVNLIFMGMKPGNDIISIPNLISNILFMLAVVIAFVLAICHYTVTSILENGINKSKKIFKVSRRITSIFVFSFVIYNTVYFSLLTYYN